MPDLCKNSAFLKSYKDWLVHNNLANENASEGGVKSSRRRKIQILKKISIQILFRMEKHNSFSHHKLPLTPQNTFSIANLLRNNSSSDHNSLHGLILNESFRPTGQEILNHQNNPNLISPTNNNSQSPPEASGSCFVEEYEGANNDSGKL